MKLGGLYTDIKKDVKPALSI